MFDAIKQKASDYYTRAEEYLLVQDGVVGQVAQKTKATALALMALCNRPSAAIAGRVIGRRVRENFKSGSLQGVGASAVLMMGHHFSGRVQLGVHVSTRVIWIALPKMGVLEELGNDIFTKELGIFSRTLAVATFATISDQIIGPIPSLIIGVSLKRWSTKTKTPLLSEAVLTSAIYGFTGPIGVIASKILSPTMGEGNVMGELNRALGVGAHYAKASHQTSQLVERLKSRNAIEKVIHSKAGAVLVMQYLGTPAVHFTSFDASIEEQTAAAKIA